MLEAINLKCLRGDRCLFEHVAFRIEAGGCLIVQGENGSGKTSLLRMIVGLTPADDGALHWQGRSIRSLSDEYRKQLLYCGHHHGLKEELSAMENLMFSTAVSGEPVSASAAQDALRQVGLLGRERQPVRTLSQGQKRRVSLSRLLLQKRPLWVLDEPLAALDTQAASWLEKTIGRHLDSGGIAVVTTHQDTKLKRTAQVIQVGA